MLSIEEIVSSYQQRCAAAREARERLSVAQEMLAEKLVSIDNGVGKHWPDLRSIQDERDAELFLKLVTGQRVAVKAVHKMYENIDRYWKRFVCVQIHFFCANRMWCMCLPNYKAATPSNLFYMSYKLFNVKGTCLAESVVWEKFLEKLEVYFK